MISTTARTVLGIVVVIVMAVCGEPPADLPQVASQNPRAFEAETVTRADTSLWTHRPNKKRGVRVTIGIPAGMDSVVIKQVEGDSVEIIDVNSVRVLVPSKLRRISVRSRDGDRMKVELTVKLGHCTRLDLVAVRHWDGGPGSIEQLPQKHELPDCCPLRTMAKPFSTHPS